MSENKEIKEAVQELEEMSLDEELRRVSELKLKYIRDEKSTISYYKKEGLAEGRAEGRAEGIEQERKKIISNMLKNGMSKEQISSMTDIPLKEIEDLLK